jgi:hypothetical protein
VGLGPGVGEGVGLGPGVGEGVGLGPGVGEGVGLGLSEAVQFHDTVVVFFPMNKKDPWKQSSYGTKMDTDCV